MDGRVALAACVLLVLAGVAGTAGVGAAQSGPSETATIDRTVTLSLTPSEPGRISVTLDYTFPDSLRSFELTLPEDSVVEETTAFEQETFRRYDWTGDGTSASITMSVPVNDSSSGGRAQTGTGNYDFVDTGNWALVRIPQTSSRWSWAGGSDSSVSLNTAYAVDGAGYIGETMAYLGPYERHRRTAAGQTFTLVVPDAANLVESPADVFDSLADASRSLRIGDRDAQVNIFVAPSDVSWGARGIQYGDTDAWVLDDSELDRASNTWLHEYIHTRQAFQTDVEMQWVTEASAEYYAGLLAFQQDRIGYTAFRDHLARGQRAVFEDTVLSNPSTWVAGSQYYRGALAVGATDRQMRLATDGGTTFDDVFGDLNAASDPITGRMYEGSIASHATEAVGDTAAFWTTTTAVPDTWSAVEHWRAFGTTPVTVDLQSGEAPMYRVSGPYGDRSSTEVPTLYPGETLSLNFTAENVGDVAGTERVTLARNSTPVDSASVTLGPGETGPLTLWTTLDESGTYALSAGLQRVVVTVADPAPVTVTSVSASSTSVTRGDTVTITAAVAADDTTPSRGTVAVTVDGSEIDRYDVALGAGETETITSEVSLDSTGERTISVGGESVTVIVESAGAETDGVPGFGSGVALVALALIGVAAARRE